MSRQVAESAKILWTDEELRRSVEAYILLLRFQQLGGDGRSEPVAQALLSGPLALRNDAAIRYRMRNISAVAQELGGPTLKDFSPAESVGRLVRPRIRAMLLEDPNFSRLVSPTPFVIGDGRSDALRALEVLRKQIEDLESEFTWRGHNGPPDHIEVGIDSTVLQQALDDIKLVETQLTRPANDREAVVAATSRIFGLGLKLAKWLGERTTKFIDAALVASAPIAVAKVTGILPSIIDAVEAVGRVIGR